MLVATACSTVSGDTKQRLAVFDTVRDAIATDYPFLGRKALDWAELSKQYRSAVGLAKHPSEFYHLLAGLLAELDDRHVSLEIPPDNWLDDGVVPRRLDELDGFRIAFIEGRVHVTAWPDGRAPIPPDHLDAAGARIPELVEIDRYRAVPSLLDVHFRGTPGAPAALTLRWRDGTLSRHVLARPSTPPTHLAEASSSRTSGLHAHAVLGIPSNVASAADLYEFVEEADFSLLRIRSFATPNDTERDQLAAGLDRAIDRAIERDEPMIIDLRGNGGGLLGLSLGVCRRFLTEPLAIAFDEPDRSWLLGLFTFETLVSQTIEPRQPVFPRRVAVLVDALTASAAELLARGLQDGAHAILIGERSAGLGASRKEVPLPDGSVLRFGAGDILDSRGNTLQDRGVLPDIPVRRTTTRFAELGWQRAQHEWNRRCYDAAREALRKSER
ncbi:MAG: hypothetical protein KDC95_08720 [Planctomycetes bacterium]|nr:hypothetical protein [Planctomycetota bacterium]